MSPAPALPTANNQDPRILGVELLRQIQYIGNQFSQSLKLSTGYIPIDLSSARDIAANEIQNLAAHGGQLASDSTPILERVDGATDKGTRVLWAAADVNELQLPLIVKPPDLDPTEDVVFHGLFAKDADANTVTCDVQAFDGVGDTEMGGATGTIGEILAEHTVTLLAANIAAPPGFMNIVLVPSAHAGDALYLYAAWLTYIRD